MKKEQNKVKKIGKNEFVDILAEEMPELKKEFINTFIYIMGSKIIDLTKKGYKIKLGNIGTFYSKKIEERKGIDPNTKKEIIIPSYKTLKFKVSNTYKKLLN